MITTIRAGLSIEPVRIATSVAVLLGAVGLSFAQDQPKEPEKLSEGVTEVTKEDLISKIPNFFYFGSEAEKRYWLRVDDKHWVERYPDGFESRFKIVGRAKVSGKNGIIARKIAGDPETTGTPNDGSFQVFIPDKGNEEMHFLFRHMAEQGTDWNDLAEMKKVE